jgi:hypothetical protein
LVAGAGAGRQGQGRAEQHSTAGELDATIHVFLAFCLV